MSGISADVYRNAQNPFASFNRLGGFGDYDDEQEAAAAATATAENIASRAAALSMSTAADRQQALRNARHHHHPGGSSRDRGDNVVDSNSPSSTVLPGGASSLDELLSRAAALDRECFDLQNEVARWERDLAESRGDIERVAVSCRRYAAELGQVEATVEELNAWFQGHTCTNDPERYDRLKEMSQEVCALKMRIASHEQQLETLLEGTLMTTNFSPVRNNNNNNNNNNISSTPNRNGEYGGFSSPAAVEGLNNDDDDTQRIAEMLQRISASSTTSPTRGGNNHSASQHFGDNNTPGGNHSNSNKGQSSSHLVPVASPTRLPQNASTQHLKRYLFELEQKTLEQEVRMLRLKEATDKRNRLLTQERENDMEIQQLRQKLEHAGIHLPIAPIQHRTSRVLRRNQALLSNSSSGAYLALAGGSEVTRRTVRLPSGILRELTKELSASVRQVAHRCGVGEIAVEIASDATLLHCRGVLRAVNSFEDEVTAAADRCKRQRALGGLVTYAVPEIDAVMTQSTDKIGALLAGGTPVRQQGF